MRLKQTRKEMLEKKRQWQKEDRKKNPEKYKLRAALYHQQNKQQSRDANKRYRERWPEKEQAKRIRSQKLNPGLWASYAALYDARKIQATPKWADLNKIKQIYVDAANQNLSVDHIIPLRGERVSGLHVETNLRLLPLKENARKQNKYWEELCA